jgi:hypothetical protein
VKGKGKTRPGRRNSSQGPAGADGDLAVRLAFLESIPAGVGDHGAVVGAQAWARIVHLAGQGGVEGGAQIAVGADPAGDDQALEAALFQRALALDYQGVDHGLLEAGGDVGVVFRAALGDQQPGVGFQA